MYGWVVLGCFLVITSAGEDRAFIFQYATIGDFYHVYSFLLLVKYSFCPPLLFLMSPRPTFLFLPVFYLCLALVARFVRRDTVSLCQCLPL